MSRSADDTCEDLERLLRRAELASARPGSSASSDSGAAERAWQEVLASAKSTLRKRPQDPLALRCAARALLSTGGDSAQIRDYAQKAVANDNEATGFTLGYTLHAYLAACHEREQDAAGAEQHYAAALSSKPGDKTAMLGLARALLQHMETARARPSESSKVAPMDAVLFCLGQACLKTVQHKEAARLLEQCLALQPTNTLAMQMLRDTVEKAVREIPDDVDLWQKLLKVYEKQQDVPGQRICVGRLIQLGGASNSIKVAQGEFLLSEGLLERAREQFQGVLQVDPTNAAALLKMATSWRLDPGGHLDEALKGYEQVLLISPSNADALEGSAYCHQKKKNLDEAVRLRPGVAGAADGAVYGGGTTAFAASTVSDAQRRQWAAPALDSAPQVAPEKQKASGALPAEQKLSLNREELIDFSLLTTRECLGTGGFGAVYRGYFRDKEVAIKKLFCEDTGNMSPLPLEELEKEIAALRGLHHPRLVAFVGACLSPPNLCIVTEYMPNGSLHHLLHEAKMPLTCSTQAKIALQVCEGVAFLHGLTPPVVHRDLKSLNIVLDHSYSAKICDFGLTQSMEKTHLSVKDGNDGSPRYMAPECYDGKVTEKVDVWAMGCIIVESFGGPLPYDDCSQIAQIVAKLLVDKQPPYIPHHLPRGVRPIIEDCFHFDFTMRTCAQDVFDRLQKLHLAPVCS